MSYQFYKSIGSPKFISAPMVDHSSLAWRLLVRNFGADLAFTEMLPSKAIISSVPYQNQHIDWGNYNRFNSNSNDFEFESTKYMNPSMLEKPLIAQLAGNNVKELVEAGRILIKHGHIDAIDLNLGCPQKCARKGMYGGFLLLKRSEPIQILKELVVALDIPITAKIRRFDEKDMNDADNATIEFCQEIEQTGVSMLTFHGRSVNAIGKNVGSCDWNIIKKVKESIPNMPIIANGGLQTYADVLKCLEFTGADGVMSSEGLLENPRGMFCKRGAEEYQHQYIKTQLDSARLFVEYEQTFTKHSNQIFYTRNHICKLLYRILCGVNNRDIRTSLSINKNIQDIRNMIDTLSRRLSCLETPYDTKEAMDKGLCGNVYWYDRYR